MTSLGFQQAKRWPWSKTDWVRIPQRTESSHCLIMGDTGAGKSVVVRQILNQIEARREAAIVYDPTGDLVTRYFSPERGDVIMNPMDRRCPYWTPADEIELDVEALTLAGSLYPENPVENNFFREAPKRIMSAILIRRTDPDDIIRLLSNPAEIDRLLAGTPYAVLIDQSAGPQRAGVLASLNMVSDALQLLPSRRATTRRWSATEWSRKRDGWVFFTSTPQTRDRLIPLISLWLDLLVLRMMHQSADERETTGQRAWFVIDELASLQKLPQLHTAMTEARRSRCPLVLAFQGRAQMAKRYGADSETMLSQPATKLFLRTSEPDAAQWISRTLGDVEIERMKQTRNTSDGWATTSRNGVSWQLDARVEPLVLPSQIEGLRNRSCYLKLGDLVTLMRVAYVDRKQKEPWYLPRPDVVTAGTPVPVGTAQSVGQDF